MLSYFWYFINLLLIWLLTRTLEAELVGPRDLTPGQEWERVAKLCEFNPKANKNQKDIGRMRSILLQLKQQPLIK